MDQVLQFSFISQDTQCVTVSLIIDDISENKETFFIVASSNNLLVDTNSPVQVTVEDENCNLQK